MKSSTISFLPFNVSHLAEVSTDFYMLAVTILLFFTNNHALSPSTPIREWVCYTLSRVQEGELKEFIKELLVYVITFFFIFSLTVYWIESTLGPS